MTKIDGPRAFEGIAPWRRAGGGQQAKAAFGVIRLGSPFADVAMETFDLDRPQLGCMNCHNQARLGVDFMWSLLDHAYPPILAPKK